MIWMVILLAGGTMLVLALFMAYVLGSFPHAIWFGRSGCNVLMDLFDNLVLGLITGLIFAWLWPAAAAVLPVVPAV